MKTSRGLQRKLTSQERAVAERERTRVDRLTSVEAATGSCGSWKESALGSRTLSDGGSRFRNMNARMTS
jgi:hypothetical protein